jgi:hypothetical protein
MATEKLYNMYSTTADLAVNMHDHCIVNPRSSSNERAAHGLAHLSATQCHVTYVKEYMPIMRTRSQSRYALDVSPPAVASTLFQF